MLSFERFKDHSKRILAIPSHSESGNEELARYLQALMHDLGMKTHLQSVNHSFEDYSKRQVNLIGFISDSLVDRSTRRGTLFASPLDVSIGNLPHLWTATQGNPQAPIVNEHGIVGAGAAQGKLDFLCKIFAAADLIDKRYKLPVYLVGTCGSNRGMMGTRFLIESLAVNPKEVYTFAPTGMEICTEASGQVAYSLELESSARDRDSRGYNRSLTLTAFGLGVDYSTPENAINAFDLLLDLILQAAEEGFDFQWSDIQAKGASGTNPDLASARISLTSFQFEDFKQFLRNRIGSEEQSRFYRVDFSGITETGTRFIPPELIEMVLEIDQEWKRFIHELDQGHSPSFRIPKSSGSVIKVHQRTSGKVIVGTELRFLPHHDPVKIDEAWRARVKEISKRHGELSMMVQREYLVPGVATHAAGSQINTNYLSDAGLFHKQKFPVRVLGCGTVDHLPKGPNEAIRWSDLDGAIARYRSLMTDCARGI